ncbi:MAG: 1-aminocyclopropane-1-carboxylate deaminase [Rhizobiales bacterium NRL2]|jgi:aspartate/methionine/tyrosine aminotransferase|nr:MAG: 1-aminocyclopropane-1-carboxylate deaminase [Rhizobiales bacterium NRL2]
MKVSKRGAVPPFYVMEVMKAAARREAEGKDVLHLEVGQPSTQAPKGVIEAATTALRKERLGYTDALGMPELRTRIARHYRDYYGVRVPAERIAVTTGSSGAFLLSFLACMDAGDRLALAEPGYPAYRNILTSLDVEAVGVPVGPETRFQPTPEILDGVPGRLDALLVATPANPTGTMLGADDLRALIAWCDGRETRLIVDEIYHGITYHGRAVTAAALSDRVIVINSFSKYFSMTGWRLGWMVVPEDLHRSVECLAQNHFISPPAHSQRAAIAAFDCAEELEANVARYRANREVLLRELPRAGFDRLAPADGAFYIYADVAGLTNDSAEFCKRMLAETGVAATPGIDFDPPRGHRYVRFSFAGSTEEMEEAAARLKTWLG